MIISAFEEKKDLIEMIDSDKSKETGIQVYIGQESQLQTMHDCSVVTATYELGEGMYGKIGIIGPKRMDYDKVVGTLQTLMAQLDQIFKKE